MFVGDQCDRWDQRRCQNAVFRVGVEHR
jgi:hypothetical protein